MTQDSQQPQTQAPAPGQNPTLQALEVLVGDWEMELSNASFLPSPSTTVRSSVAVEWVQDNAFLLMRMGERPPSPSTAIWLISRDESFPTYTMLYYDARHVSRVYEMSFSENVWKVWRQSPGFSQRFLGEVSGDGKTVIAHWEKSTDGTSWEHDFDVTYKKLG